MKKIVVFICAFCLLALDVNAKGSILMEYSTGQILMDENSLEHAAPASMTNIMTT